MSKFEINDKVVIDSFYLKLRALTDGWNEILIDYCQECVIGSFGLIPNSQFEPRPHLGTDEKPFNWVIAIPNQRWYNVFPPCSYKGAVIGSLVVPEQYLKKVENNDQ